MNAQVLTTPQWSKARKLIIHELMPRGTRPARNINVGKRLKLARMAMGWGERQGRFAQEADISLTAYNQWESGENYPGVDNAIKLCKKHIGLTLDWIYRGNMDGMPTRLSSAIRTLSEAQDIRYASEAQETQPAEKVVMLPPKRRRKTG